MNRIAEILRGLQGSRSRGFDPNATFDTNSDAAQWQKWSDAQWAEREADKQFNQDYRMAELDLFRNLGQRPARSAGMPGNMPGSMAGGFSPRMGVDVVDTSYSSPNPSYGGERPQIVNNLRAHLLPYEEQQAQPRKYNFGFRKF